MGFSLARLHREGGETGHLGEFLFFLGTAIFLGGITIIAWGYNSAVSTFDATVVGALFMVAGAGCATFGAYGVLSGWGRHHPKYDHGGDPAMEDTYSPEGDHW